MIKINGDKKTREWYQYMFKYGTTPRDPVGGLVTATDEIVLVHGNNLTFNGIYNKLQKMCNHSDTYNKNNLRGIVLRLLTLGLMTINPDNKIKMATDDCLDSRAQLNSYIFRHDLKAIGKQAFIKKCLN